MNYAALSNRRNGKLEMRYVDAHCHVDLLESADRKQVCEEVAQDGAVVLAVTNLPSVFEPMRRFSQDYPGIIPAIGFHPELVGRTDDKELGVFDEMIEEVRFVGEIGLDRSRSFSKTFEQQRKVFEHIVSKCARFSDRILSIHSRGAVRSVIEIIGEGFPGTPILHWFSGTLRQADEAVDMGFYFSVNTAMARSQGGQLLLAALPDDHLLTESDAPFVRSVEGYSRPCDVEDCIREVAEIRGCSTHELKRIVLDNWSRVTESL